MSFQTRMKNEWWNKSNQLGKQDRKNKKKPDPVLRITVDSMLPPPAASRTFVFYEIGNNGVFNSPEKIMRRFLGKFGLYLTLAASLRTKTLFSARWYLNPNCGIDIRLDWVETLPQEAKPAFMFEELDLGFFGRGWVELGKDNHPTRISMLFTEDPPEEFEASKAFDLQSRFGGDFFFSESCRVLPSGSLGLPSLFRISYS